jgi:hypothetical protein
LDEHQGGVGGSEAHGTTVPAWSEARVARASPPTWAHHTTSTRGLLLCLQRLAGCRTRRYRLPQVVRPLLESGDPQLLRAPPAPCRRRPRPRRPRRTPGRPRLRARRPGRAPLVASSSAFEPLGPGFTSSGPSPMARQPPCRERRPPRPPRRTARSTPTTRAAEHDHRIATGTWTGARAADDDTGHRLRTDAAARKQSNPTKPIAAVQHPHAPPPHRATSAVDDDASRLERLQGMHPRRQQAE